MKKSVIVSLNGGLGNQMFQYAAARSLTYRNHCRLFVDISNYSFEPSVVNVGTRFFSLLHFNIMGKAVTKEDFQYLFTSGKKNKLWKFLVKLRLVADWKFISEPADNYWKFDPEFYALTTRDNIWLADGFWQNPRYFSDIVPFIQKEFTLREALNNENLALENEITECQSVSIHIRRGDMVHVPVVKDTFGVLDLDYYHKAVKIMAAQRDQPHFFIFSDDPFWVEDSFKIDYPTTVVKLNPVDKDYLDLNLMSKCKNHIIANSTFSWWGAWLGKTPSQKVIAPKKPFRSFDIPIDEYYPPDWVTI